MHGQQPAHLWLQRAHFPCALPSQHAPTCSCSPPFLTFFCFLSMRREVGVFPTLLERLPPPSQQCAASLSQCGKQQLQLLSTVQLPHSPCSHPTLQPPLPFLVVPTDRSIASTTQLVIASHQHMPRPSFVQTFLSQRSIHAPFRPLREEGSFLFPFSSLFPPSSSLLLSLLSPRLLLRSFHPRVRPAWSCFVRFPSSLFFPSSLSPCVICEYPKEISRSISRREPTPPFGSVGSPGKSPGDRPNLCYPYGLL